VERKDFLVAEKEIPIVVPKRLMVFAGHPDDEIVSCGGTILKYQALDLVRTALKCRVIELGYSDLEVKREIISEVTNLIRDFRPQVILLPHFSDFHRVHRNLSLITREAIYHCSTGKAYGGHERNWTPLGVYYYESPSCKFQYIEGSVFIIVNIEKYWVEKKEIFNRVYKSQKEVLERVLDWAEDTSILRGNEINSKYGEAYIPMTEYTPLKILLI
jgi:LmbE family N-acetylglucosaminyl deacetylase